jgi:hypothetical protein
MSMTRRIILGLVLGLGLSLSALSGSQAQELPTGAGRLVEKVQTRIFISTAMLKQHVAAIVANQPTPGG